MRKFLLPALFLFFFIMESIFVELLPVQHFNSNRIIVPHFLLIVILFFTIYGNKTHGIIYGFAFGLLFDIVYTEVIGIYLFMIPLIAYITSKMMQILQSNIIIVTIVSIVGVALLELGVYEMNYLIKITSMDFTTYTTLRLLPTLILNLAFTIIVAYPLKKFFEKYAIDLKKE